MSKLKGIIVGAGYFSRFHHDAWSRIDGVEIVANCDRDVGKARAYADEFQIPRSVAADELQTLIADQKPDFVDIVTPPATHFDLCRAAIEANCAIICQKPLAPDWDQTLELAKLIRESEVRFMVHENWRWQPWYRQIKHMIDAGDLGDIFHCSVHCRMGDGWGDDAYLARQPFFRDYQRLFIFETGVHFLDTFRFLFGEVKSLVAKTAQRNSVIQGEDSALVVCEMESGASAVLDANRYNESSAEDARYTFGTVRVEGSKGHVELDFDGSLRFKSLGQPVTVVDYQPSTTGFAGDCVFALQRHFVDCMRSNAPFESSIDDYLKTVSLVEAAYKSAGSPKSTRAGDK